ncbi:hypothetical protein [Deinococcus aquiradiocola]|uniref:Uncharacterized protein n=1 Tax=Deinococcus aquiradiocola TaxID=393059 RepID=A0A917P9M6_9DEIO|nr:hypothetical protein [Deinococcus aquiradiocola]GGJ67798.1 hypothetical protein GCM10008939_10160 [Deinococcus aquiradiocola]
MTVHDTSALHDPANRQAFETCIALTLQMVAAVEFGPATAGERPSRDMLLQCAVQVERNAREITVLSQSGGMDITALGERTYRQLASAQDDPLRVAYHALHSAAFLGLEHGATTAAMLATVAVALRVLAGQGATFVN